MSTPETDQVLATPLRPYAEGAPLVAVHESEWEDAEQALSQVPELEDALANADAYARRLEAALRDLIDKGERRSKMVVGVSELRALLPEDDLRNRPGSSAAPAATEPFSGHPA